MIAAVNLFKFHYSSESKELMLAGVSVFHSNDFWMISPGDRTTIAATHPPAEECIFSP